jgi:hypothetical protein
LNLGGSVYGVWVLVNKLNLYNLVVVYTIGSRLVWGTGFIQRVKVYYDNNYIGS